MRALIIGGTGTISTAVVRLLVEKGWDLYVLNRGMRKSNLPEEIMSKVTGITADIGDEKEVLEKLGDLYFDVVCEFIGFVKEDVERDFRLFHNRTNQYIYISSASAYHKPARNYIVDEGTTLANPHWQYSRNKIASEEYLMKMYREEGFSVTIVRPSHTYDEKNIPLGVHGGNGFWQVIKRMQEGKPVIIQGDGTSLWTLTFNKDFAVGFVGLMGNPHAIGEAFQITSDETLSWNQIYEIIADALHVPLKPYYIASDFLAEVGKEYDFEGSLLGDKSVSVVFDNSKVKRVVPEFCPTVSFYEGVRIALDHIMSHEECQQEDPEFDQWCDRVIEGLEKVKKDLIRAI